MGTARDRRLEPRDGDAELSLEQLERTPMFAGLEAGIRRRLGSLRGRGAVIARRFREGDVVLRQGEPGWTAFYVLRDVDVRRLGLEPGDDMIGASKDGPVDLEASVNLADLIRELPEDAPVVAEVLVAPDAPAPTSRAPAGVLDLFFRRRRSTTSAGRAPIDTARAETVGTLRAGQLFGEQACFTHQPRVATVRAVRDAWMLEIMGNVLELALENEAFRDALEAEHRERLLRTQLASIGPFAGVAPRTLERVRAGAQVQAHGAEDVVFREGDASDAVFLVLQGHLRIERDGRVLRYVGRGDAVGIDAVLDEGPRAATCRVHDPSGGARRGGKVRCELLRVDLAALRRAADEDPALGENLRDAARDDLLRSADVDGAVAVENLAGALGLLDAERVLLIDLDKCTHCDDCVRACSSLHDGVPQLELTGPSFGRFLVSRSCRQCADPACLAGCPVGSIHRGPDREIVIEDWCIGCGLCAEQCPYDAIDLVARASGRRASTCDQCAELADGEPMCVYACGAGAARRVDGRTFFVEGESP